MMITDSQNQMKRGNKMGIVSSASGASCWRGLDYYKNKKIKFIEEQKHINYWLN